MRSLHNADDIIRSEPPRVDLLVQATIALVNSTHHAISRGELAVKEVTTKTRAKGSLLRQ